MRNRSSRRFAPVASTLSSSKTVKVTLSTRCRMQTSRTTLSCRKCSRARPCSTPPGKSSTAIPGLASLLGFPADGVVGLQLQDFVEPDDRENLQKLLSAVPLDPAEGELRLRRADGSLVPAKFYFSILAGDEPVTGVLVSDLTTEKAHAELASRIQSVQDEERRGLARELHDSVGQLLAAVSMNLARFRTESPDRDPDLMALMEDTTVMVEQVSKEIRTISHLLHPPLLDVAGLSSAVRWYVDGFSERSKINVALDIPSDCGRLSSEIEIAVFRMVQECLTNVYRHSGSKTCSIAMQRDAEHLRIQIADQGRGIRGKMEAETTSRGLGLRGMQERLRQLGGSLDIASTENGTTVTATVPVCATMSGQETPQSEAV